MRINRFLLPFDERGSVVSKDKSLIHQIREVLHLKEGSPVILINGEGLEVEAKIKNLGKNSIEFKTLKSKFIKANRRQIVLCLSILKRDNFDFAVQKATEIGVTDIVPLITERTVKTGIKEERLLKIIKEASEQSGRVDIPSLHPIGTLKEALDSYHTIYRMIMNKEGENLGYLKSNKKVKNVAVFVGPEGGWSKNEIALFKKEKIPIYSLLKTTLRGETAATIASFVAVSLFS